MLGQAYTRIKEAVEFGAGVDFRYPEPLRSSVGVELVLSRDAIRVVVYAKQRPPLTSCKWVTWEALESLAFNPLIETIRTERDAVIKKLMSRQKPEAVTAKEG